MTDLKIRSEALLPSTRILARGLNRSVGQQIDEAFSAFFAERKERTDFLTSDGSTQDTRDELLRIQIVSHIGKLSSAVTDLLSPAAWDIMQLGPKQPRNKYENFVITCYSSAETAALRWWRQFSENTTCPAPPAITAARQTLIADVASALRETAQRYPKAI